MDYDEMALHIGLRGIPHGTSTTISGIDCHTFGYNPMHRTERLETRHR